MVYFLSFPLNLNWDFVSLLALPTFFVSSTHYNLFMCFFYEGKTRSVHIFFFWSVLVTSISWTSYNITTRKITRFLSLFFCYCTSFFVQNNIDFSPYVAVLQFLVFCCFCYSFFFFDCFVVHIIIVYYSLSLVKKMMMTAVFNCRS